MYYNIACITLLEQMYEGVKGVYCLLTCVYNNYCLLTSVYNNYCLLRSVYNNYYLLTGAYNNYCLLRSVYNNYCLLTGVYNNYCLLTSVYNNYCLLTGAYNNYILTDGNNFIGYLTDSQNCNCLRQKLPKCLLSTRQGKKISSTDRRLKIVLSNDGQTLHQSPIMYYILIIFAQHCLSLPS